MLYGGGGMNNNVRSRRTSSQRSQRRTSSQRSQRRTRTGRITPMRRTKAIPGRCIGTAVEPIEYDFDLDTYDCSILSTPPYTNEAWCVEMPGCTWIRGDIR